MSFSHLLPLRFTPQQRQLCLRPICGHDELAVGQAGSMDALALLGRLLVRMPEGTAEEAGTALRIATADRDRAMALVYKNAFGAKVEATLACNACAAPFDLDFSLDDLLAHHESQGSLHGVEQVEPGVYRLPGLALFRLPTGSDEAAVWGLSPDEAEQALLERCLLEGDPATVGGPVQEAMRAIAPVFAMNLAARCPECGNEQLVHFDMQAYLLSAIMGRRKRLMREVHRLARAYNWGHAAILELPGHLRRSYVELVESEFESS